MTSSLPMKCQKCGNSILNKVFSHCLKVRGSIGWSLTILQYFTNKAVPFRWIDHFVNDFYFIHRYRLSSSNVLNLRLSTFLEDS